MNWEQSLAWTAAREQSLAWTAAQEQTQAWTAEERLWLREAPFFVFFPLCRATELVTSLGDTVVAVAGSGRATAGMTDPMVELSDTDSYDVLLPCFPRPLGKTFGSRSVRDRVLQGCDRQDAILRDRGHWGLMFDLG